MVKATNVDTNFTSTTQSNEVGLYVIPDLPPGRYRVIVQKQGFATIIKPDVVLHTEDVVGLNFSMEVGSLVQSVTVAGGVSLLQTETTTLGHVVAEEAVKNLPLVNRNYTQILSLSPGVGADVTNAGELGRNTADAYVNGQRPIYNNYQMDGAEINNFGTGRAGDFIAYSGISIPNPDAILEFKVQTGLYDAAFGRSVGANVNVVTKSGTNEVHGNLFEFFRNDALNASDFFVNRVGQHKPVLKQNQFGGTLGGPLRKDKLFFFGSYQRTRQVNGVGSNSLRSSVLPPLTDDRSAGTLGNKFCGQNGAFGGVKVACDGSNINPVALKLLNLKLPNGQNLIPTPQVIQPNGLGFSVFSVPSRFTEDQVIGNVDYLLSPKNTLSGRWFYSRDPQVVSFTDSNTPGSGAGTDFQNQNVVLKLTSVVTPRLVNSGSFAFSRSSGNTHTLTPVTNAAIGMTQLADQSIIPPIIVSGLFSLGGSLNDNFVTAISSFQWSDDLTWVHGRHTVRGGYRFDRVRDNFNLPGPKRGELIFLSFPDFLLGLSAAQNGTSVSNVFVTVGISGDLGRAFRNNRWATYFQDDFKIHPRFNLNLGVRWDVLGGVSDAQGRMAAFWPQLAQNDFSSGSTFSGFVTAANYRFPRPNGVASTGNDTAAANGAPLHNWAPRVGFTWRPFAHTERFVVRAGYGIFYAPVAGNQILQLIVQEPFLSLGIRAAAANALATFQVPGNPPVSNGPFPLWVPRTPTSSLSLSTLDPQYDSPISQSYSVNTQYEFSPNLLLEVGYVGVHGTRVVGERNLNQPLLASSSNPVNGVTTNTVGNAGQRVPILGMAPRGVGNFETRGSVLANSLQVSLVKRFSRGLQFQTSYTFGKSLDDSSGTTGRGGVFSGLYTGDVNNRRQARGRADFDRTHRFVNALIWEVPRFHKDQGFAQRLLNGWQISGVVTIQSGQPLLILDSRSGSIYGANSQRAQLCPGQTHANIPTSGSATSRLNDYFNTSAFCAPPAIGDGFGFGDLGRGAVEGPGQTNFDLGIAKRTTVGGLRESANLEFRCEFFNAFNHPQFANPANNVRDANFGIIGGTSVAPRIIQLALKYNF